MTRKEEEQQARYSVVFACQKCGGLITSFTFYGHHHNFIDGKVGWKYMVRCHNETEEVSVSKIPKEASPDLPHIVAVFEKPGISSIKPNRPKVLFHCHFDEAVSHEFDYQKQPEDDKYVFVVTCRGHKCQGRRFIVKYTQTMLDEYQVWDRTTPVLLPINLSHVAGVKATAPAHVPDIPVEKQRRKIRFE